MMTLVPQELVKAAVKALKAGHEGLAKSLKERLDLDKDLTADEKADLRQRAEDLYANRGYDGDDIEIDDEPSFSIGDDGVWVSAWLWVANEAKEETDGDSEEDDDGWQ